MKHVSWLMVLALAFAAPASAADADPDPLQVILEQQQGLRADLDEARMPALTRRQVNAIRKAQATVFALTEGRTRLDELTVEEKVRLDNALERINAELGNSQAARDAEDQCRRERRSGSQLTSTQCATAGERDRLRDASRNALEKRRICEGLCG